MSTLLLRAASCPSLSCRRIFSYRMTAELASSIGKLRVSIEAHWEGAAMTNVQVRLLAAAIAMLAGVLAAGTDNLNVNVGIVIILVSGAMFVAEYVRCQR